ncbi:MAG: hypothetical protein K2J73_06465 [Oscillospiraceae bacterium]|nr:hypothetical protein [Oscillospiraceae bacterium]
MPEYVRKGARSYPLPLEMTIVISHPFHRSERKEVSPSADGDQRALPSGLLPPLKRWTKLFHKLFVR